VLTGRGGTRSAARPLSGLPGLAGGQGGGGAVRGRYAGSGRSHATGRHPRAPVQSGRWAPWEAAGGNGIFGTFRAKIPGGGARDPRGDPGP